MKYETYKKLTPEQKEEYNYRFKDNKLELNSFYIMFATGILILSLLISISTFNIQILGKSYEDTQPFLIGGFNGIVLLFISTLFYLSVIKIKYLYIKHQEHKWKKENNIKTPFQLYIDKKFMSRRR